MRRSHSETNYSKTKTQIDLKLYKKHKKKIVVSNTEVKEENIMSH